MTEFQREQIVERMFPDWPEHLNDGKVIDQILKGLARGEVVFNRCSASSCRNVARPGLKTCTQCAARAAPYTRTYARRKATNREETETSRDRESNSSRQMTDNTTRVGI